MERKINNSQITPMSGPENNSDGNGDIQRMFGPVLRYFKCEIGGIDDLLVHSRHLVSENEGILALEKAKNRTTFPFK